MRRMRGGAARLARELRGREAGERERLHGHVVAAAQRLDLRGRLQRGHRLAQRARLGLRVRLCALACQGPGLCA